MPSLNKVILIGNLTRDVEVKYTPKGTAFADMGLAVNRTWFDKQSNSKKEEVTFVDVTLWGTTAENAAKYLSKGKPVLIEGRLHLESWDDKQSGQKRSKLKVVCESMQFLESRGGQRDGATSGNGSGARPDRRQEHAPQHQTAGGPPDDEVPF